MKTIELIDYKENPGEIETGTCELCFGIWWSEDATFKFKTNKNEEITIYGLDMSWGDIDHDLSIDNVILFNDYLSKQAYSDDTVFDIEWLEEEIDKYNEVIVDD